MSNRNGNRNGNRNNGADIDIDIEDGVYLDDDDGANANANANTKTNTDMVNDDEDEDDGLMLSNTRQRRRKLGSRRGYYESVTTNRANNSPTRTRTRTATICRRCCWIGSCFVSTMCQTVVIVTAMILVGTAGFLAGSAQPDLLIVALNATTGFDLTTLASKVGDIDGISISTSVGNGNGNGTGLDDVVKDLVKASASASMAREKAFKVRYDPSSVLANKGGDEWENPFNLPPKNGNGNSNGNSNSVFLTPPHPFSTATHGAEDQTQTQIPAPVGFLKSPHLAGDRLVFLSEGDAYVTTIAASGDSNSDNDTDNDNDNDKSTIMPMSMSMPAARVTTTIGNVIDPKWHPTLPLLAYTATYSGRRDVYLMDLSASSSSSTARSRSRSRPRSPMRLTYWDVGAGGVSGVVGWIKTNVNDNDAAPHEHANALVIRALSNDASLPDYRLYVIHLSNTNSTDAAADDDTDTDADTHTDASSAAVLQVEPVPLAQAMEAAWFDNCWYFVRVKQSSHTIRYVGGTAENLWKYCGGSGLEEEDQEASTSSSSSPLFRDDEYRGTSKSPQLYHHSIDGDGNGNGNGNGNEDTHFLFFLSDRGRNPDATGKGTGTGTPWVPDRMNVWALPLYQSQKERTGRASYSTDDLIQITDTACDFEGRTIQEFSIDQTTGNLVARIGADLYFMPRASVRAKIDAASQRKSYRYRYRYSRALQEQDEEAEQHKAIENELTETEEEGKNPLKEEMEEGVVGDVDSHYEVEVEADNDENDDENDDVMRLTGDQDEDYGMNSTSMTAQTMQFGNSADDEVSGPASAASQTSEEDVPTESGDSGNAADAAMETIAPSSSTPPLSKAQAQAQAQTQAEETNTSNHILDSNNSNIRDNTGKKTEEKETNNNSDVDTTSEDQDQDTNSTKPPSKYYYNFESPELVTRSAESDGAESGTTDHYSGTSTELKRLPIVVYSDFSHDQERLIPLEMASHYRFGDVYETLTGSTQMLLTLRGQLWVAPVGDDDIPKYVEAGKNLPARRYRVAPGATMGGATRVLAAIHVPNPVEDDKSDRRLAVILATDPLTPTAEHAFYLVETQPGATPLFVDMNQLPKPFLGGMVSGGSTRDGGLGSVKTDTLAMSPCGNRMAWSDTDGRIVVMNMPQYQQVKVKVDDDNDDDNDNDDEQKVKFVVLPKQNELGEPMIGDEVQLSFSPGGRYLAINHHAKNRFQIISIADLGDPLGEENKIADIDLGRIRIVQATPSKFNSVSPYWGKTPTDIHDFAQNKTMAKLFGVDEPDDVATALYFLSDRDVKTDVTSPWGYRQRMPHFVDSYAVYVLPLLATGAEDPPKGQFRGGGAEELQVDSLLERMDLLKALLEEKTKTATSTQTQARQRQRRELAGSLHPLAGAFGFAERSFRTRDRRRELVGEENEATPSNTADSDDTDGDVDGDGDGDGDDYLEEAEFDKDMDIDFGPVDLTFARTAYRLSSIPAGDYDMLVCQNPSGDILLVEDSNLVIFQSDGFPSDQYEKKTFAATSRTLGSVGMSSNRKFIILVYAPDGAIRVVPNTATGTTALQSDLVLDDSVVDADGMHLSIWPTLEYRQLYDDAWRMLRDYFYDPDMTGIDWPGIHERYLPLVERCSKREELDDVLVQMSSELSALHVFVYGGEYNLPTHGDKDLEYVNEVGSLGAILKRTPAWKGYTVMNIPEPDPDFTKIDQYTTIYSPLSEQSLRLSGQRGLQVGDVIVGVNGESVMSVPDIHMLLRGTAGRSMRLDVLRLASGPSDGNDDGNDDGGSEAPAAKNQSKEEQVQVEASVESIITVPLSPDGNANLLYHAWEWKTEQLAEKLAKEAGISVGYVHLKDMSGASAEDAFARGFFPNYHKQGFILDVRHNRGGSIDSWVLDVLQRKAWMYWQSRDFSPETGGLGWDEHYAFRGHLIVLVDEKTSSDGEGVSRGISELGLGKIIGTRTWGGGIWLASDNHLVDGGIATAPEVGDYNDNFGWGMGIEQMGLEPDIVVDNDPHETYRGKDRQLERAIEVLKLWIEEEPIAIPKPKTKRKDMTMGERECKAR